MKAIVYEKYGPPEVLKAVELEKPVLKADEVLVKVHATTVTAGVLVVRSGRHPGSKFFTMAIRLLFGLRRPRKKILGYEFSGEIEAVGPEVRRFSVGEQVFGTTTGLKNGAYAEYLSLPEEWKKGVLARKPVNCSHEEAAALPIGGMTANHLLNNARVRKGMKILIYGASGSVGTYAVQLARYLGGEVTGVCSGSNLQLVRSLGAEKVIDYTKEEFTKNGETYDVIFDAVGKISRSFCKNSIKSGGVYLTVKSPTSEKTEVLTMLGDLMESGKIKAAIDRTYPLEQIVEAHRYCDTGHKKGNVVIVVQES